jgi:hypothetical protein
VEYVIVGSVRASLSRVHPNQVLREVVWRRVATDPVSAMLLACPQSAKAISDRVVAGWYHTVESSQYRLWGWTWMSLGTRWIGKGRRRFEAEFTLQVYTAADYEVMLAN